MGREDGAQCPARCDPRPPLQAQGGPPNVCVPQVPPREPRPACRAEPQPLGPRPALSSWGSERLCGAGGGAGEPPGPLCGGQPVGGTWQPQEGGTAPTPEGPTTQERLPLSRCERAELPPHPPRLGGPGPWCPLSCLAPPSPRPRAPRTWRSMATRGSWVQIPPF